MTFSEVIKNGTKFHVVRSYHDKDMMWVWKDGAATEYKVKIPEVVLKLMRQEYNRGVEDNRAALKRFLGEQCL